MTIWKAISLLHDYGNVGRGPEDLLTVEPSESQLDEAVAQVKRSADEAGRAVKDYFAKREKLRAVGAEEGSNG